MSGGYLNTSRSARARALPRGSLRMKKVLSRRQPALRLQQAVMLLLLPQMLPRPRM